VTAALATSAAAPAATGLTATQWALIGGGAAVAVGAGVAVAAAGGGGGGDPSPPPPPPPPLPTPPNATGGLDNVGMREAFNVQLVFSDSGDPDNDRISVFSRTIRNDGSVTPWVATSLTNVNLNTPRTLFIPDNSCCNELSATQFQVAGVQVRLLATSPGDSGPATVRIEIQPANRIVGDAARNLRNSPVQFTDLGLNEEAVFAVMYVP